MGPVKTAAIKSTIRQIKSSNIMREIRFAPSVPGTISLPLSRFPPTGDYIMGYLVTCIVSDIHNNKNITMHSILDTGSMCVVQKKLYETVKTRCKINNISL